MSTTTRIAGVEVLLDDVSADAPCGPDLEYDPDFLVLEQNVLGKPEVQYGDTIVAAVLPEWKLVKEQALALSARTHDLRVALPLLRALLALHALPGFADGVRVLERLVAERWDSVHPQLDPDDDNDPLLRINSLAQLVDPATVLRELRDTAFIVLPGLGPLTLRMLEQANGETPPAEGESVLSMASIAAALADVPGDTLEDVADAVARARASLAGLDAALVRHAGSANALGLDALERPLRRMAELLSSNDARAGAAADGDPQAGEATPEGGAAAPRAAAISGEITSRADVVRMLDKILAYYQRYEPSSPLPMLLERAKRLAPMSFMEVMENLVPDSLQQLNVIRGPQPGEDGQSDY